MLLLPLCLMLTSCFTQRLPDGAYVPAGRALPATQSTAVSVSSSRTSRHRSHSAAARAAEELGINYSHSDNADLLTACASYLGTPYRYGGNDRSGLDCSGFTTIIYRDIYGIGLHRRSIDQYEKDVPNTRMDRLRQGDLVFFTTNGEGTCSHVGIYLKEGRFVHASSSRGVVVDGLSDSYYAPRFLGGGSPPGRSK